MSPSERLANVRPMKPIPETAAKAIATGWGYDQVVIIARRTGVDPEPNGGHMTSYGVDADHAQVAAMMGRHLAAHVLGWTAPREIIEAPSDPTAAAIRLMLTRGVNALSDAQWALVTNELRQSLARAAGAAAAG